nr:BON domain-containing protein [Sphingopyxis panaciterrae]
MPYAAADFGRSTYRRDPDPRSGRHHERGFFERAGDEFLSWFGDEDAQRRRERDHRGRGPSDYIRSDDRIRDDVNDRLTEDRWVDASAISVAVAGGEVTLGGQVDSKIAKRRAEDLADDVTGVKHVQNNLRVDTSFVPQGS